MLPISKSLTSMCSVHKVHWGFSTRFFSALYSEVPSASLWTGGGVPPHWLVWFWWFKCSWCACLFFNQHLHSVCCLEYRKATSHIHVLIVYNTCMYTFIHAWYIIEQNWEKHQGGPKEKKGRLKCAEVGQGEFGFVGRKGGNRQKVVPNF